jgi:hypothetical protein
LLGLYIKNSPFGSLPPLIPVPEAHNFLDVQLVFTSTTIVDDFVDEDCDLGNRAIQPVEQAQFKGH